MVVSDNSVYAQLTKLVGPKAIVKTAHALGIRSELDPYFSIGLGAVAVNPLDMTRAYATFANRGVRVDGSLTGDRPRVVETVEFARTGAVSENRPVGKAAMTTGEADLLTSILQRVVTQGTGKRAALADRPAAGKTGTTDNYGDAWFVGYTPQLAVAVWVGYPDKLQPMLTEFGGKPVAGRHAAGARSGSAFMTAADEAAASSTPEQFPATPYLPAQEKRIVWRGGSYKLDNGYCPGHAGGRVLRRPRARRRRPSATRTRSRCRSSSAGRSTPPTRRSPQQPLGSELIGVPAKAGKQPGLRRSSRSRATGTSPPTTTVRLYVTRPDPRYGLLAEPRRLEPHRGALAAADAQGADDDHLRQGACRARCSSRRPEPGVAAGKGLKVTLIVGRGDSPARAPDHVAPRQVGRLRDARPAASTAISTARVGRLERERRLDDRAAVVAPR